MSARHLAVRLDQCFIATVVITLRMSLAKPATLTRQSALSTSLGPRSISVTAELDVKIDRIDGLQKRLSDPVAEGFKVTCRNAHAETPQKCVQATRLAGDGNREGKRKAASKVDRQLAQVRRAESIFLRCY